MSKRKDQSLRIEAETGKLIPAKLPQKIQQWIYGFTEPAILRTTNYMLKTPKRTKAFNKMATPKALPREVVVTTEAACRFIDYIYSQESENGTARMAVTKCVCQTATNKFREPVMKDMALLYTADMYTTMKHTGIKEPFYLIETAEKAKEMVRYFNECGLVHAVMYCHSAGKWTFVMCNCDDEICIPVKAYKAGRRDQVLAGPEIAVQEYDKCVGCGKCAERCMFDANENTDEGKYRLDPDKCLGCGLCESTCEQNARRMTPRSGYEHEDKLTTRILLGELES